MAFKKRSCAGIAQYSADVTANGIGDDVVVDSDLSFMSLQKLGGVNGNRSNPKISRRDIAEESGGVGKVSTDTVGGCGVDDFDAWPARGGFILAGFVVGIGKGLALGEGKIQVAFVDAGTIAKSSGLGRGGIMDGIGFCTVGGRRLTVLCGDTVCGGCLGIGVI